MDAYSVVRQFEQSVAEYANSPYAVALDSCTNALFLSCKYLNVSRVTLPSRTYPSVPCAVIHSGGSVNFAPLDWQDSYQLRPYSIVDAAGLLRRGMYRTGTYFCLSFSANKPLPIGKGGMILTDDKNAVDWFKQARYCGRHEVPLENDRFEMLGWNMYMTPEQAARGLILLQHVRDDHQIRTANDYPDLSSYKIYGLSNPGVTPSSNTIHDPGG